MSADDETADHTSQKKRKLTDIFSERTELKKRQLDIEERKVAAQEKQLELLMLLVKDKVKEQ